MSIFVQIAVGDGHTDPSPSNSDVKAGQISNSRLGDTEVRRSLRYAPTYLLEPHSFHNELLYR
jgi:hypothetical protein